MKFFKPAKALAKRFTREEDGATAIEYGLLAALIAAVIIVAVSNIGQNVNSGFESVNSELCTAAGTATGTNGC
ncbi:MAG: Flp family type IVb pilin [Alphaproteobacteria bacterium]|nr:Flp family type IVb pilin [Alphaproteobacteria bacterium]